MMEIVQLNTIEDVYKAYYDVKNTFENLENEVNIDDYLHKIFQFGKVFGVYEKNADKYFGFSAVYMNDFETKTAYITLIGVSKDYKHKHIGTKLLLFSEEKAKEFGMEFMRLEVKKNNSVAISFYKKNNYEYDNKETDTSFFMLKKIID